MWEDPQNKGGGKWVFEIPRNSNTDSVFDRYWQLAVSRLAVIIANTLIRLKSYGCSLVPFQVLSLIGECFEGHRDVCGIVASIRRKENKLSIWTRNAADRESCMAIGQSMKKIFKHNSRVGYQVIILLMIVPIVPALILLAMMIITRFQCATDSQRCIAHPLWLSEPQTISLLMSGKTLGLRLF